MIGTAESYETRHTDPSELAVADPEIRVQGLGFTVYSPPQVDRIWGTGRSYYHIPKAIFYLLKGDCKA